VKLRAVASVVSLALSCGCGARSEDDAPEPARPDESKASSLLSEVSGLARRDPALAKSWRSRRAFVTGARGFESSPSAPADSAFVRLASDGDAIELGLSRRNRALARLRTPGMHAADLRLEDGYLLGADVGDLPSIWLQSADTLEQLLLSESGAGVELHWQLELKSPIVAARRERSGALLLTDADDRGVLRVPVPYGVDGAGQRVAGSLSFALERTHGLHVDLHFSLPATEHPPLLIDPALAVVLWQEREGTQPASRVRTAVAYSPALEATVLYGGDGDVPGEPPLDDTWAYDGHWTQLEPKSGGPPRYSHALAYTASPDSLLLFGGRDDTGVTGSTYRWQAGTWTEVASTGPVKRDELAMTYAPSADGDVLLFGGYGQNWLSDTWIWNGSAWLEKLNAGGEGGFGQSLVYDTARGRPLVFGGARSIAVYLSSLALFNGTRWVDTPDAAAPTRAYAAMAFDSDRQRAVLFGGEASDGDMSDETWEWDSASAKWSLRATDVSPPPLVYASMAYDVARKRAVLVGGWVPGYVLLGQTWEYRALGGSCETTDDCDGVACVDGACCAESECGACEACSTATGQCEPLKNQPDPDSCSGDQTCDAKGVCKLVGAAACSSDRDCAEGACADGVCCDRACDGACEACDVEGSVGTCSYVMGEARHGSCAGEPPCGGACDGSSSACSVAESDTPCGSSCDDGLLSRSACDGKGRCVAEPSAECPQGFGCADDATCRTDCAEDDDCQPGLSCRQGACARPSVFCKNINTLHELDGTERSCAPFACVSGHCLESCASAAQCAEDLVCDDGGHCIAAPDSTSDDVKGCGCRVGPGSGQLGGAASALLLGLALARSRRNSQKRKLTPSRGASEKKTPPVRSLARK
jgi:MYXO-CTERM domain-containing protein